MYVKEVIFKGLNNKLLFKLGSKLKFFEGVIELFKEINEINKGLKELDIVINIYIVLNGFRQMILGSIIAPCIARVWVCEFIGTYLMPFYQGLDNKFSENNVLSIICYFVDHTIKTRVIFELNKVSYDKINQRFRRVEERFILRICFILQMVLVIFQLLKF